MENVRISISGPNTAGVCVSHLFYSSQIIVGALGDKKYYILNLVLVTTFPTDGLFDYNEIIRLFDEIIESNPLHSKS